MKAGFQGVFAVREREVPEPLVVEPWWRRFGSTALTLLRQIAQRPLDPLPRLILADFLEENGAPARAEFIRLQVQQMPRRWGWEDKDEWTPRERELWQRHRDEWLEGLPDLEWIVWGGLVEGIVGGAEGGRKARQHLDLRRVELNAGSTVQGKLEWLVGVVALSAEGMRLGPVGAEALAQSPHLHNLTTLNLARNGIGAAGAEALAQSPHLHNLTTLNLSLNRIGAAGVEALAQSPHLHNLTTLNLARNGIGAAGAEALAQSPYLQNLTTLDLASNGIGTAGVEALAQSPYLQNLTTLDLSWNELGAAGAEALAKSSHLHNLTTLDLSCNRIGAAGAEALAKSPHLQNLTTLYLWNNQIGAAGREALRNSPYLRRCEVQGL
jgi:uncharacterized protein (TIGR02996 family)